MNRTASERYQLRLLPAGRNDRVVEILDREGRLLKLIFCPCDLAAPLKERLDARVRHDYETMDAAAFARRYDIATESLGRRNSDSS